MPAVQVLYCNICSLPPEYCEYGSSSTRTKCKAWLKESHLDIFAKLFPTEVDEKILDALRKAKDGVELEDSMDNLNISTDPSGKHASEEQQSVQQQQPQNKKKKKSEPAIIIKRTDRNKRKSITTISGMETFSIDLKKAAKLFAGKFACGSSVTKSPQGTDEITIQGDVQDALVKLICDTWNVPADAISIATKQK